nr:protein RFT1 homolog [Onthophagus taurus]
MSRNVLKSSLQNASFNIIFQILFRCVTFVLNAFIIRYVGQDVLGIMNVRLLLLESTILFLSREPLLKACLTDTKSHNWAQVINQIWLSVPLSGLLSICLVYVWINVLSSTDDQYLMQYQIGCYAVAFSCVIDQIAQPVQLVAQSYCFVKLKVIFETIYITARTITFVILVINNPENAIHAFSIAQVSSSLLLCLLYYEFFYYYIKKFNNIKVKDDFKSDMEKRLFGDMQDFKFKSILDFIPGFMSNNDKPLNKKLTILTISFAKQSVIKQVLTEGEKYVMTISPVLTFSQQSMYDIVNNLGSLAARFIFRPIEDSAYFYFTQMIKRDSTLTQQDQKSVSEATIVLSHLCKVVTSIGLIAVFFGNSYSYTLLFLYGGTSLTETNLPTVLLKCHCIAVLLLAVNGVTECYVFATMNNKQLDRYNYLMVLFSISFLLLSYILTMFLGPVGFIFANCLNMAARIMHSVYYISHKYKDTNYKPLDGLIPGKFFIFSLILSLFVTKWSEHFYLENVTMKSTLIHILIGAICFLITISIWVYENKHLATIGFNKYKRRLSFKSD